MLIIEDYSLEEFNTFGLDVSCRSLLMLYEEHQLEDILPVDPSEVFILGGGSNVLLTTPIDRLVIKNEIEGIKVASESDDHVILEVGGGVNWHEFVLWSISNGYGGIENLSLIPGTVGAAPIQNIGAYGVELKEVFVKLKAFELATGKKKVFNKDDCVFGYRDSVFKRKLKSKYIITKVYLRLSKNDHKINISYGAIRTFLEQNDIADPSIKEVSEAVIAIRQSKLPDPKVLGNSGSFFKNPEIPLSQFLSLQKEFTDIKFYELPNEMIKVPAGWLIEQCGWKGKVVGHVGCYEKQALVIVNYGGASPSEIIELSKAIQKSVEAKFGIALETEVNFIE